MTVKHLDLRLRTAQHCMYGSGKFVMAPKLIIGYTPKLLINPFVSNLTYASIKQTIVQNVTVDVNFVLDYAPNKKRHIKNADACLAEASFDQLPVNTPYPNSHCLVAYTQYCQKRFNELLWPLDVDLPECLRKTGYDRRNGNRPADLTNMAPFLVLRVHERWHIYGDEFVVNREFPVSLSREGYLTMGDENQAMYHKVQRHWEPSAGFEYQVTKSADGRNELISHFKTFDTSLPALLLANFDGALTKYPVNTDLINRDANYELTCGLDTAARTINHQTDCAIYFPVEKCVYYDSELLSLNNQYGHLAKHEAISPQPFAWLVRSDWKPVAD